MGRPWVVLLPADTCHTAVRAAQVTGCSHGALQLDGFLLHQALELCCLLFKSMELVGNGSGKSSGRG